MKFQIGLAVAALLVSTSYSNAIELNVLTTATYSPSSGFIPGAEVHQKLYDEFQQENPDITLNYEVLDPGPAGLRKLLTLASSNTLPDAVVVDGQWIPRLVQSDVLQPLDDFWPEDDREDFHPAVIEAETIDGQLYGVMFQTGMRGLFYRPSALEANGLDEFPATLEEMQAAAETLSENGMTGEMVPAKADDEPSTMHLLSIYWGLGGELVDDAGKPVFFEGENAEHLTTVFQMYRDMVESGVLPQNVTTMNEADLRPFFYGGETLSIGGSSSGVKQMWSELPDLEGDLAVASYPMPDENQSPVTILGGFAYGITAKDVERAEAAWKFVQFMTESENLGEVAEAIGVLPVRNSIWETNEFFSTNPIMQSFRTMYEGEMKTRPAAPIYTTISSAISSQLADVMSGEITPEQAVDAARDAVMPEYERQENR